MGGREGSDRGEVGEFALLHLVGGEPAVLHFGGDVGCHGDSDTAVAETMAFADGAAHGAVGIVGDAVDQRGA